MIAWQPSPNVPIVIRPAKPERTVELTGVLARVKSALDAIPNCNGAELDYDRWRNVIFSIHYATDGSDEGLALADEFSSRSSKHDPDFLANRVWPYIRGDDRGGEVITERTLYSCAGEHGWIDPAIADAFDVVVDEPAAKPAKAGERARFAPIPAHEFAAQASRSTWIVRDVIPDAELTVIFGESGSGKSFFTLDLVLAIARGVDWRGKTVEQRNVIYIAAEGANGFRNRLKAYAGKHEIALDAAPIAVIPDAPNFTSREDITDLVNALRRYGRTGVVVVDTLARVMPGANENASEDVGRAIAHCRTIHEVTGAHVILIHHSGKDAAKGARGWSGLRAAADAELEIARNGDDRTATVTKLKDGEDGARFGFRLARIPVEWDADNELLESCWVEHVANVERSAMPVSRAPKDGPMRMVWQAVVDLRGVGGPPFTTEVIDLARSRMPADTTGGKRDTRRQVIFRALTMLTTRNLLRVEGDRIDLADAQENANS